MSTAFVYKRKFCSLYKNARRLRIARKENELLNCIRCEGPTREPLCPEPKMTNLR